MPGLFFPSSKPRFIDEKLIVKELRNLAKRVARKNKDIEAVYLFGSFACGNAGLHSDADILVILKDDKRNMFARWDKFILEFSDGPVPVDVLVYTRTELSQALKEGSRFLTEALKGIRLI